MIYIENVETYGWEAAVRGMRNPLNSWSMSDSIVCRGGFDDCANDAPICPRGENEECFDRDVYCVGDNDYKLMWRLIGAGNDHSKFMRMIGISMDITAPLYWWKEYDTYKVGTVADSCSTMHKIAAKPFEVSDFSIEHLLDYNVTYNPMNLIEYTIGMLNYWRDMYNKSDDDDRCVFETFTDHPIRLTKKECWWQLIQLLPSSYNQRRTVTLNYAVARNMYHARKNHKLDEWHVLCKYFEELPYGELITMEQRQ